MNISMSSSVALPLSLVDAVGLVPLKAKAWLDLQTRKNDGQGVDEKDIRKHRNDILRLSQLLTAEERAELPAPIRTDLETFLQDGFSEVDSQLLRQIGLKHIGLDEIMTLLRNIYLYRPRHRRRPSAA